MKLNNLIYVFFSFLFFTSCSGMNDIIEEYLDRGEINYIGKTDSIYSVGGKERITFKWLVNSDPRIENFVLEWMDGTEKRRYETKVDRTAVDKNGYVTHHLAMPDVEGTFIFKAFHTGELGYQSVPSEVTGTVYANKYAARLITRKVRNINLYADKAVIDWELAEESFAERVEFIDNNGQKQVVDVASKDESTELLNVKPGSEIILRSLYVAEPESEIVNKKEVFFWDKEDEFWTEKKVTLPEMFNLREDSWTISDFSSEETSGEGSNGRAAQIIDGNPATYWHNRYNGGVAQFPHHITIDMQGQRMIKEIAIAKRIDNADLKKCHLEVSTNGSDWTPFGEALTFDHAAQPNAKTVVSDAFVPARYVKLVITESHRQDGPFVTIGEVSIYGKVK